MKGTPSSELGAAGGIPLCPPSPMTHNKGRRMRVTNNIYPIKWKNLLKIF